MRIHPLDDAEYLLLTTFRRDGSPVPTPLWFAGSHGRYVAVTQADSGKVKRIRSNPRVEVAACTSRGSVLPGAAVLAASARELTGRDADVADALVRKKYGLKWKTLEVGQGLWRRIRRSEPGRQTVIEITLSEAI